MATHSAEPRLANELHRHLIVRGMQPHELDAVADGIVRNMPLSEAGARWMRDSWPARLPLRPDYRAEYGRVGVIADHVVSHLRLEPLMLRYGAAQLDVMGVGAVYTEAPLRGQGIAAAVMRDALAYAAEQGAGLALLHGVRGYYPRFGFSPVWPKYSAAFDSEELAALPCPLAIRPATLHDLPDLMHLYDRAWGGRVACERPPEVWAWRLNGGDGPPYGHDARRAWVVVGEDDRAQGYMAGRAPTGEALEVVAGTPEAALSLLAISGRWHREAGLAEARWQLTPDDPLVAFAQGAVAVRLSADYLPDGGWMGRVVDMSALLKALRTEIVSQARQVYPRLKPGDLVMEGGAGGVAVGLRAQPETIAQIKQRDFIQVLFGSVGPAALGLRARLTEAQIELLAACFPPRMAALAVWDWF